MADGVGITEGSGKVVATDEKNFGAGPVHVQAVMLTDARDGNTNKVWADANGNLYVRVSGLKDGLKQGLVSVPTATATPVPASALAGRSSVMIQNISGVSVFVGASNVAVSGANRGIEIASGRTMSFDAGEMAVYVIQSSGSSQDVVYLEIA